MKIDSSNSHCLICNKKTKLLYLFSSSKFKIFSCMNCKNAFNYPIPQNISSYYKKFYWSTPGLIGVLKNFIFRSFQMRRSWWIEKLFGKQIVEILDVGSGEGLFSLSLPKNYITTNVDHPNSQIKNKAVIKTDFPQWRSKNKFDAIVFWQSLEHVINPEEFLDKSRELLKNRGYLLIEYPRFDSWESKLFKQHWFHLDPPRHLSHFTDDGIKILLKNKKFSIVHAQTVAAPEYTIWGFIASTLNIFNLDVTEALKSNERKYLILLATLLIPISIIVQLLLKFTNKSPLGLIVARKN